MAENDTEQQLEAVKSISNTLDAHDKILKIMANTIRFTRIAIGDVCEEMDELKEEIKQLKKHRSWLYRALNFLRGKK